MKLSPALICRELSQVYRTSAGSSLSLKPTLKRPMLLGLDEKPGPGTLCILAPDDSRAASAHPSALLVAVGKGSAGSGQLMVDAPSLGDVYNQIQKIFNRYESWYTELVESRLQGQSIQALLELSYPIFQRPLVVIGMDFSVIASVRAEALEMTRGIFGATESTYGVVTDLKHNAAYAAARTKDGCFYFKGDEGRGSLCVNIKKYDQTTYRILAYDRPGEAGDLTDGFLLETLAGIIEHALLHNTAPAVGGDQVLQTILLTAISDRTADYVTISQRMDATGWLSSHFYLCVVLQVSYLDQKNLTVRSICGYLENILSASCAFQFKDDIVVFVNLSLSAMSLDEISARLSFFIRDSLLKAGYSRVLLGHFNFRRQYDQAMIAMEVGSRLNPSFWIHRFNDVAFPYILEQITRKLPAYMVSHERLLRLKYADEENGTEYFRTLRLYLDNHFNAVQTARELYIHRSTFLYRLERIKAILGTDFTNSDENLYLMLSYRLLDREEPGTGQRT